MAYTPGVARVVVGDRGRPAKVWNLTIKQNMVAVVTDGTAVLGLGDIGPRRRLPVMEGKAMLFKEFGGVDAFPICLATKDVDEIVAIVKAIAPGLRRHQPRGHLRAALLRDRGRGCATSSTFRCSTTTSTAPRSSSLAALHNALEVVGKRLEDLRVVVTGVGAAGVAVTKILLAAGVARHRRLRQPGRRLIATARASRLEGGDTRTLTNPRGLAGDADEALAGADVFIGLSQPGAVVGRGRSASMADGAIVFAMANPTPEVTPEEIAATSP